MRQHQVFCPVEGQHVPDLWLQFAAPFKDTEIFAKTCLAVGERNDTGAPPLMLSGSYKHCKDKQVQNSQQQQSHTHIHKVKTDLHSAGQKGSLSSYTWFADFTPEYGCTADGEGVWLSHPPSPSCFSLLASLQSYRHCVSFVHTESCTFSSPHISLIHRLITHCRPCRPPRAQKKSIFFCSTQPHPTTQHVHPLLRDFCVETTTRLCPQSFNVRMAQK